MLLAKLHEGFFVNAFTNEGVDYGVAEIIWVHASVHKPAYGIRSMHESKKFHTIIFLVEKKNSRLSW